MYDKIKITLDIYEETPLQNIQWYSEQADINNGYIVKYGKLDNLRIMQTASYITIKGSLAKYYFGNNLSVLTRRYTEDAINRLNDTLGINFNNAKVTQLEIGGNFYTKYPAKSYFSYLGNIDANYNKYINQNTLYINNGTVKLKFYDKSKELQAMKHKNKNAPEQLYKDQNILRYEIAINSAKIKDYFGKFELKLKDLYSEAIYIKSLDLWKHYYFKVQKVKLPKIKDVDKLDTKSITNMLASIGLDTLGYNEIMEILNQEAKKQEITPVTKTRLMQKIKELNNSDYMTKDNTILELDNFVVTSIANYV
jgi:hypothetical protein